VELGIEISDLSFHFCISWVSKTQILGSAFGLKEAQILSATLRRGFLFAYAEFKETLRLGPNA
jgi:hypothetical protein